MSIMLVSETSRQVAITDRVTETPRDTDMQVHKTTWTSSRGIETVETPRKVDETEDAWNARHDASVAAKQLLWPPVD
jgi:hypothetical protein